MTTYHTGKAEAGVLQKEVSKSTVRAGDFGISVTDKSSRQKTRTNVPDLK